MLLVKLKNLKASNSRFNLLPSLLCKNFEWEYELLLSERHLKAVYMIREAQNAEFKCTKGFYIGDPWMLNVQGTMKH